MKVGETMSWNLMKVHGIKQSFSQSKTFIFNKISSCIVSLMDKIFCFTQILQILTLAEFTRVSETNKKCSLHQLMEVQKMTIETRAGTNIIKTFLFIIPAQD